MTSPSSSLQEFNRRSFLQLASTGGLALLGSSGWLLGQQTGAEVDVVIYGATPAGFCAAIGAAREGVKVMLIEPTDHIGGVVTGGLSFSDGNQMVRAGLRGVFEEFYQRMEADYVKRDVKLPYTVAEKEFGQPQTKPWTHEPHVATRVMDAMLKEAGVIVLTKAALVSVRKEGGMIRSIATSDGKTHAAKAFVDATYEGDLMAAAGVSWTIGREGRTEFGESYAGKQYPKKRMDISGLDAKGDLLPLLTTKDAGPDEEGDKNVMVYSFRLCLTTSPEKRVAFPEPEKYDPARFEVVRRYFQWTKNPMPLWDHYPLPGRKIDANNGIGKQFSMGLIGACNGWSEGDQRTRQGIWEAHKQYTLEMYRFLTTDASVPENIRKMMANHGLCQDEFASYGHWSPALYVREGRRMQGAYVLSQKDVLQENKKEDSIALASFPIDSHDCQRVAIGDMQVVNEGTIMPVKLNKNLRAGPEYQVPYRSITPKAGECDNLLVPVAISATHVAYSSIRVEPAWMVIGHSAGVAAALAAKSGTAVQKLEYPKLKERLLAQKQILDMESAVASVAM
jgi:hypothetical protein